MKRHYKKALYYAAEEAYRHEVVDTLMVDSWIGSGKEYADKEDWVEQRVQEWLLVVYEEDVPSGDFQMTPDKYIEEITGE